MESGQLPQKKGNALKYFHICSFFQPRKFRKNFSHFLPRPPPSRAVTPELKRREGKRRKRVGKGGKRPQYQLFAYQQSLCKWWGG